MLGRESYLVNCQEGWAWAIQDAPPCANQNRNGDATYDRRAARAGKRERNERRQKGA